LHIQGRVLLASTGFTLSLVVCPLWSAIGDKTSKTQSPKKSTSAAPYVRRVLLLWLAA